MNRRQSLEQYRCRAVILSDNRMLLSAKGGRIIAANAVADRSQKSDISYLKLIYALLPTFNENLFRQWMTELIRARLNEASGFLFYLITGDFNNAVRLCKDPRLAAVIASISVLPQDPKTVGLLKRQVREFQLGKIKYDLGWEVLIGNPINKDPLVSLAIKMNSGAVATGESILEILRDLRRNDSLNFDEEFQFLEKAVEICTHFSNERLGGLIALLPSLAARMDLALHLNADPAIVNKLKSQIQELQPGDFDTLISQGRFYEAGSLLSARMSDDSNLNRDIDRIPDNYLNSFFPKLAISQLSQRLASGDLSLARTLGSLMDRDLVYLQKERKLRSDLAEHLAREFGIFVDNDLAPNVRLLYL
jgi:hypothetical protein